MCLFAMDKKRNNGEGGVNPGKVGHFSLLSQDKMLKRRDECTAGGQKRLMECVGDERKERGCHSQYSN